MIDAERLIAAIKAHGDTQASLAAYLGVSRQNVGQVLKGRQSFTIPQVAKIAERYGLDDSEIVSIFIFPDRGRGKK